MTDLTLFPTPTTNGTPAVGAAARADVTWPPPASSHGRNGRRASGGSVGAGTANGRRASGVSGAPGSVASGSAPAGAEASDAFDVAGGVESALDVLLGRLRAVGGGGRLEQRLRLVGRCESRLAAVRSETVAAIAHDLGDKAAADAVRDGLKESRGRAKGAVKLAGQLAELPDTADALADGSITAEQAKIIADAADAADIDEQSLIDAAEAQPVDDFKNTVRDHVQEAQRDADVAEVRRRQRHKRRGSITQQPDGMYSLHALFDALSGAKVAKAVFGKVDELWNNEHPHDRRTPEQRVADAVEELLTRTGPGGTPDVTLVVHADYDLLTQATRQAVERAHNNHPDGTGTPADENPGGTSGGPNAGRRGCTTAGGENGDQDAPAAHGEGPNAGRRGCTTAGGENGDQDALAARARRGDTTNCATQTANTGSSSGRNGAQETKTSKAARRRALRNIDLFGSDFAQRLLNPRLGDGTPLTAEELLALACGARVVPGVFDRNGQALWLGTAHRRTNSAQRLALESRDRHCIGCRAPADWCQPHHIIPWAQGGPTDLDNLVLLCHRCHHHDIHTHGYQVIKHPDGHYTLQHPNGPRPPPRR